VKLSLNIGLNYLDARSYNGFEGWLNACENDATALAALAASRGYESCGNFTERATLGEFRRAMANAADTLKAGDSFFLTFSGHGGQLGTFTELDGYNETLCFFNGQLVDNEFRDMLAAFKAGVTVLCVLDSCHSGGMDRALDSIRRPRCLPARVRRALPVTIPAASRSAIAAGVCLLTACAESELASDGDRFGEWTGALISTGHVHDTNVGWFRRASNQTHGQTPQLKILGADVSASPALA